MYCLDSHKDYHFSNKFELDGMMFEKNSVPLFETIILMETVRNVRDLVLLSV